MKHISEESVLTPLRRGSRPTLHLPSQEVEKETAMSPSRGTPADLPSCQSRYRALHFNVCVCQLSCSPLGIRLAAAIHPVLFFRARDRTEERRSTVGGREQLGGSAEGRLVWEADGGGSPRVWGGFQPERLHRRAQCCHPRQKGSCCQHKEVKKRNWPSRYLSHCFIVPLCRSRGS